MCVCVCVDGSMIHVMPPSFDCASLGRSVRHSFSQPASQSVSHLVVEALGEVGHEGGELQHLGQGVEERVEAGEGGLAEGQAVVHLYMVAFIYSCICSCIHY